MKHILLNIYVWLFAKPCFYKLNKNLLQISLRGLGVSNWKNDRVSGEKWFVEKALSNLISAKKPVLFDVGANVGNYTQRLANVFPNAEVHCFEPHPKTFSKLAENVSQLSVNVCINNLALSDKISKLELFDRADEEGSEHASLYRNVIEKVHQQQINSMLVDVQTLENYCNDKAIQQIDFLKIDTEGNEFAILRGAQRLLAERKIKCIQFEFGEMNIHSRVFFSDFRELLQDYNLFRLLPKGMIEVSLNAVESEIFAYQNIVAIVK